MFIIIVFFQKSYVFGTKIIMGLGSHNQFIAFIFKNKIFPELKEIQLIYIWERSFHFSGKASVCIQYISLYVT